MQSIMQIVAARDANARDESCRPCTFGKLTFALLAFVCVWLAWVGSFFEQGILAGSFDVPPWRDSLMPMRVELARSE